MSCFAFKSHRKTPAAPNAGVFREDSYGINCAYRVNQDRAKI